MKILVLGGGGYIGSTCALRLSQQGHDVHVIDLFLFSDPSMFSNYFTCAVRDARFLTEADFEGYDAVLNFAALSNDPAGELDPNATLAVNVEARVRSAILAKKAGVPRFVLISSCSVYGANDTVVDEQSPKNPLTTYAVANCLAEKGILDLASDRFSVTALRLGTVFGLAQRMRFDLVINVMTLHAHTNRTVAVGGNGMQYRPFIHVEDVCRLVHLVLAGSGAALRETVLNAVNFNMKIRDIAYAVVDQYADPVSVVFDERNIDFRNYYVSGERARRLLGFEPMVGLVEGVERIRKALVENRVFYDDSSVRLNGYKAYVKGMDLYQDSFGASYADATRVRAA